MIVGGAFLKMGYLLNRLSSYLVYLRDVYKKEHDFMNCVRKLSSYSTLSSAIFRNTSILLAFSFLLIMFYYENEMEAYTYKLLWRLSEWK